jgi:DNA modification methylase
MTQCKCVSRVLHTGKCGLRDYGTASWDGGDPECDHMKVSPGTASLAKSTLGPKRDGNSGQKTNGHQQEGFKSKCGKCGAVRIDSQIGLEQTPAEYVDNIVAVFREVWRVLRPDGSLWLNLGDSYCSTAPGTMGDKLNQRGILAGVSDRRAEGSRKARPSTPEGLKPKDLVGIPWRVAFALQEDGWYLRQDIIWAKPNPMPESVTDRCTKSHEYIFLLTKSERYYYDADAIAEPCAYADEAIYDNGENGHGGGESHAGQGTSTRKFSGAGETRNKRSVWTVNTKPYRDAHFATFPPDLIKPCILAGARPGDTVLDPFGGSGTTGEVAVSLGRKAVLCELNPEYVKLIEQRTTTTVGLGI